MRLRHPLVRDWRPRHVRKISYMTGDVYCHRCGRGRGWPCAQTTFLDWVIAMFGGRSR